MELDLKAQIIPALGRAESQLAVKTQCVRPEGGVEGCALCVIIWSFSYRGHVLLQESLAGLGAGGVGLIRNFRILILLSFLAGAQSFQFPSSLALRVHIVPVTGRCLLFPVVLPGHLQDSLKITQTISGQDTLRIPGQSQAWQMRGTLSPIPHPIRLSTPRAVTGTWSNPAFIAV